MLCASEKPVSKPRQELLWALCSLGPPHPSPTSEALLVKAPPGTSDTSTVCLGSPASLRRTAAMHPNSRESLRPPTVPLGPTHIPSSLCSSLTSPSTARAGGPGRYLFSAVTPLDSRCRVSPGLLSCPLHPPPRRPSHRWGAGAPASIAAVGGNPALETGRRCCQKWKQEPLPCHPPLPPGPDPTRLQLFPVSSFFENGTGSWGNDCCHLPLRSPSSWQCTQLENYVSQTPCA